MKKMRKPILCPFRKAMNDTRRVLWNRVRTMMILHTLAEGIGGDDVVKRGRFTIIGDRADEFYNKLLAMAEGLNGVYVNHFGAPGPLGVWHEERRLKAWKEMEPGLTMEMIRMGHYTLTRTDKPTPEAPKPTPETPPPSTPSAKRRKPSAKPAAAAV